MTYQGYLKQKEKEVNDLPIFWAFSIKQFKKAMEERGLDYKKDHDQIIRLPITGCFALKKDAKTITDYFTKKDDLKNLMKDPVFAKNAFRYEMDNHEYLINHYQGDYDVCSCFGPCEWSNNKTYKDYLTEMGYGAETLKAFKEALIDHRKSFRC